MKRFYLLVLVSFFTVFGLYGKSEAISSLERFIGIKLNGFEELSDNPYTDGIFDRQARVYNAAMAAKAAYFSAGSMAASPTEIPELLGASRYQTLVAPNTLFGFTTSTEEKGLVYTTEINGEKTLVLSFRGTSNPYEWLTDANFINKTVNIGGQNLNVHTGFYNVFNAMKDQTLNSAKSLMAGGDVKRIIVTGHSLGGAVASIMAPFMKDNFKGVEVDLITFEAPKAFDKESAAKVAEIIGEENVIRIADDNDLVTKVGHGIWAGGHVGEGRSEWNMMEGNGIGSYHSMERVAANHVLQGFLIAENRLIKEEGETLRNVSNIDKVFSEDLHGFDKRLASMKQQKHILKSTLALSTNDETIDIQQRRELDNLKQSYTNLKNRRNKFYSKLEKEKEQALENFDKVRAKRMELKTNGIVDFDNSFLAQTASADGKESKFISFIKKVLSIWSNDPDFLLDDIIQKNMDSLNKSK
jgi:hypothetical protein